MESQILLLNSLNQNAGESAGKTLKVRQRTSVGNVVYSSKFFHNITGVGFEYMHFEKFSVTDYLKDLKL